MGTCNSTFLSSISSLTLPISLVLGHFDRVFQINHTGAVHLRVLISTNPAQCALCMIDITTGALACSLHPEIGRALRLYFVNNLLDVLRGAKHEDWNRLFI